MLMTKVLSIGAPYQRCIGCNADVQNPTPEFACPSCGDRLEIAYRREAAADPDALKKLWRERKSSFEAMD